MYVIFDMDGVILNSERVYLDSYIYAASVHGLPKGEMMEAAIKCTGVTEDVERRVMIETFGKYEGFSFDKLFLSSRQYFDRTMESGRIGLKDGVRDLLEYLKFQGIRTGLASSSSMEIIENGLKNHNILSYFDIIVSGDMVSNSKPDPEIFIKCASLMGLLKEDYCNIFVIEDSYNGIRAASRAGMNPVMVPDCLPPTDEMRELALCILPSLTDVRDWIEDKRRETGRVE